MASRKSASDPYNNGPISYLDDVPFKLNDKFRCPAKVGLPVGFCVPDYGAVLADTKYDFTLETRSVRWGIELADARAAVARAEEAAAAKQEAESRESLSRDVDGGGGNNLRSVAEDQDLPPPALNPVLAGLSHNAILTPLPAPSLGPRKSQDTIPQPQNLNLADFEREEDPFDKLELKTLDDKEELRNILQSQPQPQHPPSVSPPQQGSISRRDSPSPPSTNTSVSSKPGFAHKPNGLVALLDLEKVGQSGRAAFETDDRPCNIRSLTFPKLSDSGEPESVKYSPAPVPISSPLQNLPNGSPPALQKTQVIVVPEPPSHNKGGTSKPAIPGTGSTGLPCGGALLSMTPSERQCVETLVGMGYSYEEVLRAMQRHGQNVEQVLDYLFLHGRLCERGFDASAVEECLEMYQCSEEKALQYLELMSRFGEMGFERDAIKEVLLVHNNDQDKALEDLMARAAAS
ncbi:Ubiquitin-associated protein 1 [Goodea atripinnis]|uniref:Ubiquitin-associated protein 1 n=1 Tax=Goodea atripinnis TaxID=208336 RepID=A0ABV0NV33_9TELE